MNRRGFFKAMAALAAAQALPRLPTLPTPAPIEPWGRSVVAMLREHQAAVNGEYIAFLHPDCWRDVRAYLPRWRWENAWHAYREARRDGLSDELEAREVLARFGAPHPGRPPSIGEIGTFEGIRFITSEHIA